MNSLPRSRTAALRLAPLCALVLGLHGGAVAQEDAQNANPRAKRLLERIMNNRALGFRTHLSESSSSPFGQFVAVGGARVRLAGAKRKKAKKKWLSGSVRGDVLSLWSAEKKSKALVGRNGRWLVQSKQRWLLTRKPRVSGATSDWLPDPHFLAEQLLHILPACTWKLGIETIDEKPMRVYSTRIPKETARRLLDSGTLPRGGFGNGVVFLGGFGGAIPRGPDTELDIRIYENAKMRFPTRIVVDHWVKGNKNGVAQRLVMIQGAPAQPEEEDKDKKPKPTSTTTIELTPDAEVSDFEKRLLDAEARKLLKLSQAAMDADKAAEPKRKRRRNKSKSTGKGKSPR